MPECGGDALHYSASAGDWLTMPINAFGGGPGSGKTYGVMEHVILPAIAAGRFVVTNIEGLNDEAIYQYVAANAPKGKIICIGHIRRCSRSAPSEVDFFPTEAALDKALPVPSPDYPRVWGGDLVVIDEATRYWSVGEKVHRAHDYFFREHRHFANEMGQTCDLVVIDPDLTLLARSLKGKVELASVTHKPKEIGLNRYVVNLYRGVRLSRKPVSTEGPYAFRKEIYSLYKSYSHEGAKEQAIDRRQNILLRPKTLFMIAGAVLLLVASVGSALLLWKREKAKFSKDADAPAASVAPAVGSVPATAPGAGVVASRVVGAGSEKSGSLRVVGTVVLRGRSWVVVRDLASGAVRLENPGAFVGSGSIMVGSIEGQRVTTWTGVARSSGVGAVFGGGGQ